jgi:hypothetical protein
VTKGVAPSGVVENVSGLLLKQVDGI